MTADLSEDVFNALALEVHAFQRRWNKPYAAFAATHLAAQSWRDIPAVPQSAFKRAALTCLPRKDAPVTFRTSGTTGESRGEHHFFDTALYDAAILRGWSELRLPRLRQVILAPHPGDAPRSSLSHMFATLAAESDVPQAWCCDPMGGLDTTRALTELRRAHESGPIVLLGTALAFLHLFDVVAPGECNLQGSIALETAGTKVLGATSRKQNCTRDSRRTSAFRPKTSSTSTG
jgi:hypothetical protein